MYRKQWLTRLLSVFIFFGVSAATKNLYLAIVTTVIVHIFLMFVVHAFIYRKALKEQKAFEQLTLDQVDTMEGIQFEHYLQKVFVRMGYFVEMTPVNNDFGADLILEKGAERIAVQVKRYKGNVGINAIQEAMGARGYYGATAAWVVTNSHFTKSARELAKSCEIRLIDRSELVAFLQSIDIQIEDMKEEVKEIKKTVSVPSNKAVYCTECNSPMVLRTGKYGVFYGCSSFPKCSVTKEAK